MEASVLHDAVLIVAIVGFAILFAVHVIEAARAKPMATKLVRMDAASVIVIALLLMRTLETGEPYYLDAALVLGLLSFVGTLVIARLVDRGGLFS